MASTSIDFKTEMGDKTSFLIEDTIDCVEIKVTDVNGTHEITLTPMEFAKIRMLMTLHSSISEHDYLRELCP